MKRFILSVLCVSVFFIGIGSIFEKTSAKFTSDGKALEIINKARTAIGGGQNLSSVQSMTIVGTTTHFFDNDGIQNTKQGSIEINMKFPGQFSKIVKIGNPGNLTDADTEFHKEIDVIVKENDGGDINFTSQDGSKKDVFILRKGDGDNVQWRTDSDGKVKIDGDKIIITNDDGTTEEIKIKGKHKILLKKDADGNIVKEEIDGLDGDNTFVFKTDDGNVITEDIENINGKKVIIMKDGDGKVLTENIVGPHKMKFRSPHKGQQNEMLRTTMALLMKAPEGMDISYKFAGEGNVDGNPSNIIDVTANGSTFKLFIDASTNLPQMISYNSHQKNFFFKKGEMKDMPKEELIRMKKKMAEPVEKQVRFSDFRTVSGLLLPHRWTESINGKQSQNIDITSYELNPANIEDKFGNGKVFVRKMKKKNEN